ncbi:MAG: helix-turn-helix domain-containing protein [Pseudomonadota bacterium]
MQVRVELERVGLFSVVDRHSHHTSGGSTPRLARTSANRVLRQGEHLFRTGDAVDDVYRVIGGVLKSYFIHEDGDEQIIGFHLPGDLIGCDALADARTSFSVVALDSASVTRESLCSAYFDTPSHDVMDRQLYACMRQQIFRLTRLLHMERSGTDARLAHFLLDYAKAQESRGYDRLEFHLPMGRKDLARYIGLVPETVSRVFSRLRDGGIIRVENNHICILDHDALTAVANDGREAEGFACGHSSTGRVLPV